MTPWFIPKNPGKKMNRIISAMKKSYRIAINNWAFLALLIFLVSAFFMARIVPARFSFLDRYTLVVIVLRLAWLYRPLLPEVNRFARQYPGMIIAWLLIVACVYGFFDGGYGVASFIWQPTPMGRITSSMTLTLLTFSFSFMGYWMIPKARYEYTMSSILAFSQKSAIIGWPGWLEHQGC